VHGAWMMDLCCSEFEAVSVWFSRNSPVLSPQYQVYFQRGLIMNQTKALCRYVWLKLLNKQGAGCCSAWCMEDGFVLFCVRGCINRCMNAKVNAQGWLSLALLVDLMNQLPPPPQQLISQGMSKIGVQVLTCYMCYIQYATLQLCPE